MKKDMKNILVVDDDPALVVFLHKRLDAAGYRVSTAVSAEAGLQAMRTDLPDLLIVDVKMPGMDGFSFVREIRADAALAATPILIVTAQEELGDIFKMEGAQGFFPKPIDMELLMEKVCALIG